MWRRYNFYDRQNVPKLDPKALSLLDGATATCAARSAVSRGNDWLLLFACTDGTVQALTTGLEPLSSFQAHGARAAFLQYCGQAKQNRNLLVTLGEDDREEGSSALSSTCLKLWDLDKCAFTEESPRPPCLRTVKLFSAKFPEAPITCFKVYEEGPTQLSMAIGLENGSVYIIRGDVTRDKVTRSRLQVKMDDGTSAGPITGLGYRPEGARALYLFCTTNNITASFDINNQPHRYVLDAHGANSRCVTTTDQNDLVVGRSEAVYFYEAEDRGSCLAFSGEKRQLIAFAGHLLVVSAASATGPGAGTSQIQIYDLRNKLLAFSSPVADIAHLICANGLVAVLLAEGSAMLLREKSTTAKLELLFRKNLYGIAISIIQAESGDRNAIAEVHRRYGDHLYLKQDYDGAMGQYLQTIGLVEPSYVIRQFLDARRIHNLTTYLEQLHTSKLATADHTTLLLNCYTKLKDVKKLNAFLTGKGMPAAEDAGEREERTKPQASAVAAAVISEAAEEENAAAAAAADEEEPVASEVADPDAEATLHYRARFDTETVIKVCRAAGYNVEALRVAARAGMHAWRLRILIEDLHRPDDALEFLAALPFKDAEAGLQKYGRRLLAARPEGTTALLQRQFEGEGKTGASGSVPPPKVAVRARRAAQLLQIFTERPRDLLVFLEHCMSVLAKEASAESSSTVGTDERLLYNTLLELLLRRDLSSEESAEERRVTHNDATSTGGGAVIGAGAGTAPPSFDAMDRRARALELLKGAWPVGEAAPRYDADHALVLCRLHDFSQGPIFLYERMGLFVEVLRCYMRASDHRGLLDTCTRLGQSQPRLWVEVLSFFSSREQDCSAEVQEALGHIERGRLLPPLVVLQTLAKNPSMTLAVVKDYVSRAITSESRLIEEDRAAVAKYETETARMRAELEEMRSSARIFQNNRCASCTAPLDLPAVHFFCSHSYHQSCLGDAETECPKCAPEARTVLNIKRSLEASASDHDRFFQSLANSEGDGFSLIAEYFGRGMFSLRKE